MFQFKFQLIALIFTFSTQVIASAPELSSVEQVIDFRISYPLVTTKTGTEKIRKNYLGLDLNYQYFLWERIGPIFNLGGWGIPARSNNRKTAIGLIQTSVGLGLRAFPRSYLDPSFYVFGGPGWQNAGGRSGSSFCGVFGTRFSLSIFNQKNFFQDNMLALGLSGSANYLTNAHSGMEPFYFDLGLALRGGF